MLYRVHSACVKVLSGRAEQRSACFSCIPGARQTQPGTGQVAAWSDQVAEAECTSVFFKMAEMLLYKCVISGCICSSEAFQVHNCVGNHVIWYSWLPKQCRSSCERFFCSLTPSLYVLSVRVIKCSNYCSATPPSITEDPRSTLACPCDKGEAFSHMTKVCALRSCWPLYQTVAHQVCMLIHKSLCTQNILAQLSHRCNDRTAEVSHQHLCQTPYWLHSAVAKHLCTSPDFSTSLLTSFLWDPWMINFVPEQTSGAIYPLFSSQ